VPCSVTTRLRIQFPKLTPALLSFGFVERDARQTARTAGPSLTAKRAAQYAAHDPINQVMLRRFICLSPPSDAVALDLESVHAFS
jgi:hypothetical protein